MKKKMLLISLIMMLASPFWAQQKSISGMVIDSLTREALPFTNIGIVGKDQGSVSNSEGYYTLSLEDISPEDSVFFSFVGYRQRKFLVAQLMDNAKVELSKNAIQLSGFSVLSRAYSPEEILDLVKANYSKNHSHKLLHQEMFSRDASYTTIHESDMDFKKSSFKAIDGRFVYEFNQNMPDKLNVYNDYLVDMYSNNSYRKLVPIEGQSLIENWSFDAEFDKRLKMLAGDVEDNVRKEENYFKVRSGVFAGKLDFGQDSSFTLTDDSMNYITTPELIRGDLAYLIKTYSTIHSKRWDFFSDYKLYSYTLKDVAIVNDELAYIITFSPLKRKAKYEGTICVATDSYALLQVDYSFAKGKKGKGMSLLGVEYLVANRSGHVIFEKGENGHYLKYLSRVSDERFGIDRKLAIKQKQEKSGFDKTLQEVKIKLKLNVTFEQKKEILVVSHRDISQKEFDRVVEPDTYKLKKVSKYTSDIWKNSSIIEPTKALKEYQQQY